MYCLIRLTYVQAVKNVPISITERPNLPGQADGSILANPLRTDIYNMLKHRPVQLDEETILLNMDKDLAKAMNQWRLAQDPPLDPATAIHVLLRRALSADGFDAHGARRTEADPHIQAMVRAFQSVAR